jgi:hypothetical protein
MLFLLADAWAADPPAPPAEAAAPEGTIIVEADALKRAMAQISAALAAEGFERQRDDGDSTVFLNRDTWKGRVRVFDDGYWLWEHQPTRAHAPGQDWGDEGPGWTYALCVVAPTSCLSPSSRLVSVSDGRKLALYQEQIALTVHDPVEALRKLREAEGRRDRLANGIPADCAAIWSDPKLSAIERRAALFAFWDSRTDTPAGRDAQVAIVAWIDDTVQASADAFTAAEVDAVNARRSSAALFDPGIPLSPPPAP